MVLRDAIVRRYVMFAALLYKWGPLKIDRDGDSVDIIVRYVFADMPDVRAYGCFDTSSDGPLRYEIRPGEFWIGRLTRIEDNECFGSNVLVEKPDIKQAEFTEFIEKFGYLFNFGAIGHPPYDAVLGDVDVDDDECDHRHARAMRIRVPWRTPVPKLRVVRRPDMSRVQLLDDSDVDEDVIGEERAGTWTSTAPPTWLPFVYLGQVYVSDMPLDDDGINGLVPCDVRRAMTTTKTTVELPWALKKYIKTRDACIVGEYAVACAERILGRDMRATRLDVFAKMPFFAEVSSDVFASILGPLNTPPGRIEWESMDTTRPEFAYLPMFEPVCVVKSALDGIDVPVYYTFFTPTPGTDDLKYENIVHKMPFTILSTMITSDGQLTMFDAYRQDHIDRVLMPGAAGPAASPSVVDEWIRLGMSTHQQTSVPDECWLFGHTDDETRMAPRRVVDILEDLRESSFLISQMDDTHANIYMTGDRYTVCYVVGRDIQTTIDRHYKLSSGLEMTSAPLGRMIYMHDMCCHHKDIPRAVTSGKYWCLCTSTRCLLGLFDIPGIAMFETVDDLAEYVRKNVMMTNPDRGPRPYTDEYGIQAIHIGLRYCAYPKTKADYAALMHVLYGVFLSEYKP